MTLNTNFYTSIFNAVLRLRDKLLVLYYPRTFWGYVTHTYLSQDKSGQLFQTRDILFYPITDTLAIWTHSFLPLSSLAAVAGGHHLLCPVTDSLLIILRRSSVSDTRESPRRGLPLPNCQSQGMTLHTLLPLKPSGSAALAVGNDLVFESAPIQAVQAVWNCGSGRSKGNRAPCPASGCREPQTGLG